MIFPLAMRGALLAILISTLPACPREHDDFTAPQPSLQTRFRDDFQRAALGPDWHATSPRYRIVEGALRVSRGYNHPLWLRHRLPRNVEIELDVTSYSAAGDIKVEIFGDGKSHATTRGAYRATGYVLIFGGWNNRLSVIARMDEHGGDRKVRRRPRVVTGRTYHWKIVRRGGRLTWFVDGRPFLEYDDPSPLAGSGHEHFGFNNWESDVRFDNLSIRPL